MGTAQRRPPELLFVAKVLGIELEKAEPGDTQFEVRKLGHLEP